MSQATVIQNLSSTAIEAAAFPAWLRDRKIADLALFHELPMPDSSTMEDWRRTDISGLDLQVVEPGHALPGGADPDRELRANFTRGGEGGALVVQQPGRRPLVDVPAALAEQGVIVSTLEDAARTHADAVQRLLEHEVVPASAGKLAALNAAFWRGGVFILVPRGVTAALPVWATYASGGAGDTVLPRTLVVVEEGGSLVFTDEYSAHGRGTARLSSAVSEVILGDGASIQYLVLQQWPDDLTHVATHRIHLGRDARAELVVAATGAAVSKVYMEVAMMGQGGTARISGLVIGDGKQHFDYQSLQDHFAPNCLSDLLVKGALKDESVSVYSGLIKIRKDAQHSDAYQANRNLLLSSKARADSIPMLEIEANDVRCTHGATVGQVDFDQLFYLQSRGFSLEDAQNTLVHGFFQPVIDRIALPQVREQIHETIDAALRDLGPRETDA
ncbi:MAG: Fe-S cluster assembly protein SufD [Candidatus Dormibacteraeota bacterium]|nr:Fe-S cluster assembly protein SufD [Candidatus Dormibacteraeota bacterium]